MGDTLNELRNDINFASISQFFHTFQSAFKPWPTKEEDYVFETQDLEKWILDPIERNGLEDLIVRMLKLLTRNRFINLSTWQSYFSKEFDKREFYKENPFYNPEQDELMNFFDFTLQGKVELIFLLCEWQLDDPERLREHLYTEEGSEQWRVDPIGYDKKGAIFWLFDDNRLYLETPKPIKKVAKKKKRMPFTGSRKSTRKVKEEEDIAEEEWIPWQLLCCSIQDWQQIHLKYADSTDTDEKKFHDLLIHDLVPKILPILEDREKEIKRQEAIIHRKRSSRIMIRELGALENEFDYGTRTRSSNRLGQQSSEREHQEKENLARAREERLLERERRLLEREYKALVREKDEEQESDFDEQHHKRKRLEDVGQPLTKKKRGRKPKNREPEEEEDWFFRCICGISGKNLDDGKPMIACEKCNTWQHIHCLQQFNQIDRNTGDLDSLSFKCQSCIKEDEELHTNKKQKPNNTSSVAPLNSVSTNNNLTAEHQSNTLYTLQSHPDSNMDKKVNSSGEQQTITVDLPTTGDIIKEQKQDIVPLPNTNSVVDLSDHANPAKEIIVDLPTSVNSDTAPSEITISVNPSTNVNSIESTTLEPPANTNPVEEQKQDTTLDSFDSIKKQNVILNPSTDENSVEKEDTQ